MQLDHLLGMARYAVFDLDGTLIDSLKIWNDVDVALAAELGLDRISPSMIYELRETTLKQFAHAENPYVLWCKVLGEISGSAKSPEALHERRYQLSREALKTSVHWREGAPEFVRALAANGVQMAIATTTRRANVDIYADTNRDMKAILPLRDFFKVIVTREDVANLKPDPEAYQKALFKLGAAPFETIVFEDTLAGVDAAKAAGLQVIALSEPHALADKEAIVAKADAYVEGWEELLPWVPKR